LIQNISNNPQNISNNPQNISNNPRHAIKLQIKQHEPHLKPGRELCCGALKGQEVPVLPVERSTLKPSRLWLY